MKYYYPSLINKLKLKFIKEDDHSIHRPWSFLEYYYLINKNKKDDFLYIPSNTQLSEFLNKFNETHLLSVLGKIKFNELINGQSKLDNLKEMQDDYGWNWVNWKLESSQNILDELISIKNGIIKSISNVSTQTIKILGRIRLKESIDYGKDVEFAINSFIVEKKLNKNYEWEIKYFVNLLEENNLVVIDHNKKFVYPGGIFQGEIDYILINKETKKIYIADLKTSTIADKIDYWRQLCLYKKAIIELNPHLKKFISDELLIFHINEKRNIHRVYRKNISQSNLVKIINFLVEIRKKYLEELFEYENRLK